MQVGAEVVRAQFLKGLVQRGGEGQQLAGEGDLGRGLRIRRALLALADGEAGLAEDGADAHDGVQEVRGGVAFEGQELLPRERVVHRAVGGEVGVTQRGDADGLGDEPALGLG